MIAAFTHFWRNATLTTNHGSCGSRARKMHTHTAGKLIIFSHNSIVPSTSNLITQHAIQETSYQVPNRIKKFKETSNPRYISKRNKPAHQHHEL